MTTAALSGSLPPDRGRAASDTSPPEWPPVMSALHIFTSPGRLQDRALAAAAEELAGAERSREPVPQPTRRHPGLTLTQAYQIQWTNIHDRVIRGSRIVGHKVGLTSLAMQQQIGVDQPDSGVLLDTMLLTSGSSLSIDELVMPRVEAEIAFRLGRDLRGPDIEAPAVQAAVCEVLLALEVIDSRYGQWRMTLEDSVADNAAAARAVVGTSIPLHPALELPAEQVSVRVDGDTVVTAPGAAVLGNPLNAVAWLIRQLSHYGAGLRAGDLVLAGAVHASLPLRTGSTIEASSPHLPPVSVRAV